MALCNSLSINQLMFNGWYMDENQITGAHNQKLEAIKTLPVPNAQRISVLIQNDFREILIFSTDSERFQISFCIDSETFLNQSKI